MTGGHLASDSTQQGTGRSLALKAVHSFLEQFSIWGRACLRSIEICPSMNSTQQSYILLWHNIFFLFFNVYLFLRDRERQHEWRRGRERGRHRTWSRLQALRCQHRARCGAGTHRPWNHDLSRSQTLNWLSPPDAPPSCYNIKDEAESPLFHETFMKTIKSISC